MMRLENLYGSSKQAIIIRTRTSHYESFTMRGTGYNEQQLLDGVSG